MKEKEEKMHFPKIDDFFTTQEERDAEKLEKVEKIMDTGITWKDSMDNQQTDSKIKRGYKRNFIKSIVEYKENQIEEIKTENLGKEK